VSLIDDALKKVYNQNKEKGRKRIPLSHPMHALKVLSRHSIKKDGGSSCVKNSLDPVTLNFIKS